MAGLQLAPHLPVGIMFPHNKTEAPGLHSTKQDTYEQGDSSRRSSTGHLRNNLQQKVLNSREVELEDVYTKPKWNTSPHSAGISQQDPAMQAEKAMADLHRTERTQIQRLEAAGESLQREIRRKEILLREKLKKTEEGLRRIQKEKEQAKENEDRELQKMAFSRRVKGINSHSAYKHIFSPEFSSEQVFSGDRGDDDTWGRPQESSSPFQLSDYGMQRLKRERLMASNNKIRDRTSGPLAKKIPQPSEELGRALRGSSPSSSLFRTPSSLGSSCSSEAAELGKCHHCGRTFLLLRLERHSIVCGRMQRSKRKVFDSSRARAKGTELEQYLNWKGPATAKVEAPEAPRKSTWRQKHESFIRTLRQARQTQQIIAKGGNPSDLPPIPPVENPDYVQCPHCSRHFARKVAERHIPKCKTIKSRPPPPRKHDS